MKKKSYWWLLALPYVAMFLGIAFNQIAVHTNGGFMPVLFPGHSCMPRLLIDDPAHVCMEQASRMKFFSDWLMGASNVSSVGDKLLEFSADVKMPSLVAWVALQFREIFQK